MLFDGFPQADDVCHRMGATETFLLEGDILAKQGDPANCFWLIKDGGVNIKVEVGEKIPTIIQRRAGEIVGEQGIIDVGSKRTATIVAATGTTVHAIDKAAIENLDYREQALLWRNFARIISLKLGQATQQRGELIAKSERMHAELLPRLMNPHGMANFGKTSPQYRDIEAVIWFSDLAGFSTIARQITVSQTADLISQAMSRQSDIIEGAGGHVDKFMGDAVMAYWIVPGPSRRSDVANAAFKAAIDAIAAVRDIAPPLPGHDVDLRIGMRVGQAKCGNFGSDRRWAWTLIGDDVNLAARLEQARQGKDGESLGALRMCGDLRDNLAAEHQRRVPAKVRVITKEGREVDVWTGE